MVRLFIYLQNSGQDFFLYAYHSLLNKEWVHILALAGEARDLKIALCPNQLQNRAMIVGHTCVGFLVLKDFYIICLCNLLNISVLDEGYSIAFTLQILVSLLKQELLTALEHQSSPGVIQSFIFCVPLYLLLILNVVREACVSNMYAQFGCI